MRVLKFGGTSVGSVDSILSLKRIVERAATHDRIVVVVSALGGITDALIATANMASQADSAWEGAYDAMLLRHLRMVDAIIVDEHKRERLKEEINQHFAELRSIYYGVSLVRDLSQKTLDMIVSYGERISSRIVAGLIPAAEWFDSREIIMTEKKQGKAELVSDRTEQLIRERLTPSIRLALMPGFISSDIHTGETTNLGRGGSDYTASIVAAALDAEALEIWTDVNGFMTADPRAVGEAYTIPSLSYHEASELCNFGAKVVYPPTIYPVCAKRIPILIKNTFEPDNEGSIIRTDAVMDGKSVRGISSIRQVALITVTGLSMVGVIGVNRRIFAALAQNGISVFMVAQASSESSTSLGVREADVERAAEVLNLEFDKEIQLGAMSPMEVTRGLAAIAIVGEQMKHCPGIAGQLFGTLGRAGISVIAFAQGASETNISFIVREPQLQKALTVLHESFFLSEYKQLNLYICGTGTVGGKLIEQIMSQREVLKHDKGLVINVVGIAGSRHAIYNTEGIDLTCYRQQLAQSEPSNPSLILENILSHNLHNSVFVDCTAAAEVADLYEQLLEHNVSIVAANKIAASGSYERYARLKQLALDRGVKYRFETNVGAGLPIIGTINDLVNSGDRVLRIEAVLSGTLNFIFNELSAEVPLSETVRRAQQMGYSEPDPRIDLSGKDVVRKILILAREAGVPLEEKDVEKNLFIPTSFFEGSEDTFWQQLPSLDADFECRRSALEQQGKRWRFVATLEDGKARVGLCEVDRNHPFYSLNGSNNIVTLTTERYREYPMIIQGYGAGAGVTAAGVFGDIMSIANV